jgi:hypothetical protein
MANPHKKKNKKNHKKKNPNHSDASVAIPTTPEITTDPSTDESITVPVASSADLETVPMTIIPHEEESFVPVTPAAAARWSDQKLTQNQLMEYDQVMVVDEFDHIVGTMSKKESHVFSQEQPIGVLHRAFSVFLFCQTTRKLLLQQRASSKITFPSVGGPHDWVTCFLWIE